MTTYAPNFTPRYRARYKAAGIEHTIQVRGARGESAVDISSRRTILSDCFNAGAAILADDFQWLSADYALTDSDVFIPGSLPTAVTGLKDHTEFDLKQRCTSTNFNGRAAGSRGSIYFYGFWWAEGDTAAADNGRITTAEWAVIPTIVGFLNGGAHAGSGAQPAWHVYANTKLNDHLLKLLRRGTIS